MQGVAESMYVLLAAMTVAATTTMLVLERLDCSQNA
jgi:hypothetical protein